MHSASTVLLLREQPTGLEVLMMRRGSTLSFMAGMWVFPGGRVEPEDGSTAALARLLPAALERCAALHSMQGEPIAADSAAGLYVAACREPSRRPACCSPSLHPESPAASIAWSG